MPLLKKILRSSYFFFLLPLITVSGYGQLPVLESGGSPKRVPDAGLFPPSETRSLIDLSGVWAVSADGEEWQDAWVPSSIDATGRFIFRRTVNIPADVLTGRMFKFVGLGMNHDAEVFVNDVYVGRHIGGYTSFAFEIPAGVLQQGSENAIEVIVHNELSARSTVPVRQQSWGWRSYGGIVREAFLVALPHLWVDQIEPACSFDAASGAGVVRLTTVISGVRSRQEEGDSVLVVDASESYLYEVTITDSQSGTEVARSAPQVFIPEPNKSIELRTSLTVPGAKVWYPGRPDLYVLRARVLTQDRRTQVIVDETSLTVGFPQVTSREGRFYERGAALQLRGIVWHEESSESGASLTYEQMERDMAMIKSLGANAVRFAFHPPHPYLLDLCSRYGLYAFVEIPVWNVPAAVLDQEPFRVLAQQSIRETVEQLRHHPAVMAWGLGGSLDPDDDRVGQYAVSLRATVESLDPRPVYIAEEPGDGDRTTGALDIAALMVSASDVKEFRTTLRSLKVTYADRPAVVISYGVQVEHENRNGYRDPWSQEAQARYFLQHIAAVKESGFSGGFVEAFSDWRGDRPVLTVRGDDRTLHPLGLVNTDREKRLAFDVVRSQYQEEKFSAIPAGTFKARFPASQVIAGLLLIIVFGYQYSYNRRFGESVRRALLRSYNFFADLRDRGDVPPVATFVLSVCLSITLGVVLASMLYHYRTDATADAVMTLLIPWDGLKLEMIRASWDPMWGIGVFAALSFLMLLLFTGLIKVVSLIARVRLRLATAWNITIWGALPLMALSPVGMSLFKIMETQAFVLPVVLLITLVCLWALVRIIKGTSVVLDMSTMKTYTLALVVCLVVAGGLFLIAENQWAFSAYLEHLDAAIGVAR